MQSPTRQHILEAIRRSLHRDAVAADRAAGLTERLARPKANLVPARGRGLKPDKRLELFMSMAVEAAATVTPVADAGAVPAAVAEFLRAHELPAEVAAAPGLGKAADWQTAGIAVRFGPARPEDAVSVTPCYAGVAETGTLVLLSGPDAPTSLNFLPDTHIAVLNAADLVGTYEEVWKRMRREKRAMPRTINLITGPSRTGDIEQTIQLGAHGPRRLHILLVGET